MLRERNLKALSGHYFNSFSGDGWLANDKCPAANLSDINRAAGDLEQSVLATGKLDALRKVDVGAQVSGQLKTLLVSIGDNVKKISYSA